MTSPQTPEPRFTLPRRRDRRIDAPDHGHSHGGHSHSHGNRNLPTSPRVQKILWAIMVPLLILTGVSLALLWPNKADLPPKQPFLADGASIVTATVLSTSPETSEFEVRIHNPAPSVPEQATAYAPPEFFADDALDEGDRVRLMLITDGLRAPSDDALFIMVDFERERPMLWLLIAYIVVVLAVARWRGAAAVIGLGVALWLVLQFTLPALLTGANPAAVALTTSAAAMLVLLYLAHGVNARTTTALLGTVAGLAITVTIATWASGAAELAGLGSEDALILQSLAPEISLRGIVLCGMILAGLGVLNDVTITQASAVWELKATDPTMPIRQLFMRGMRIGRDHIASTVYTIAFAYIGSALLLLLIVSMVDRPFIDILTSGEIAEEIVRTLVSSIGLVLAIPITTGIAALVVSADSTVSVEGTGRAEDAEEPTVTEDGITAT